MTGSDEKASPAEAPDESDLLRNRRENLRRIEALGVPAMPVRYPLTATVAEIVQRYGETPGPELEASPATVAVSG